MKAARPNPLLSTFVVLVILFTGMLMATGGSRAFVSLENGMKTLLAAPRSNDRARVHPSSQPSEHRHPWDSPWLGRDRDRRLGDRIRPGASWTEV